MHHIGNLVPLKKQRVDIPATHVGFILRGISIQYSEQVEDIFLYTASINSSITVV